MGERRGGNRPVQLTAFEAHCGSSRFSPDGRKVAFDSLQSGNWDIYVVDADGGQPRRMTQDPSSDTLPFFARDGRSLYFSSGRSGRPEIWRMPADGGPATQVTRSGGWRGEESWDGRYLYYFKSMDEGSIWRLPLAGGGEGEVEVLPGRYSWMAWAVSRSGLYFMASHTRASQAEYSIHFFDFDSGRSSALFTGEGLFVPGGMAVSPDEEWIVYSLLPRPQSELMLVENFR